MNINKIKLKEIKEFNLSELFYYKDYTKWTYSVISDSEYVYRYYYKRQIEGIRLSFINTELII